MVYLVRYMKLLNDDILDPDIKELLVRVNTKMMEKWKPVEGKLGICSAVALKMLGS